MKTERSSNIELLRVVAMFFIVFYHIYYHCIGEQLINSATSPFNAPQFYPALLIPAVTAPLGKIGDVVFILISGYFLVPKKEEIRLAGTARKLILQQGFAALLLVTGSLILFRLARLFFPNIVLYLADISLFNNMSWFVGYYFTVIVIARLFLNRLLSRFDRQQYTEFLLAMFVLTQFFWTIQLFYNLVNGLQTLMSGVFIYALGGYIRQYDPFKDLRTGVPVAVILLVNVLICLSSYNYTVTALEDYTGSGPFKPHIIEYSDSSLVPLLLGVALFELFRRLRIPGSKVINFLGASTFMVYLMHDNEFTYCLWRTQDWLTPLYNSPAKYLCEHLGWTALTFGTGVLAYALYLLLGRLVQKCRPLVIKEE